MELTLGAAIGRALEPLNGVGYLHLPQGVDLDHAVNIVASANAAKPMAPAYAFLVSRSVDRGSYQHVPFVSWKEAVRFRRGNHAAVVHGRLPDLASFSQAFRELLGQSYPEQAKEFASLKNLANIVVQFLAEETGSTLTEGDLHSTAEVLERCLKSIQLLHRFSEEGLRTWNSVWFDHADLGIRNLGQLVHTLKSERSNLTLQQVIASYARACFGLPNESGRGSRLPVAGGEAKTFNSALNENWRNSDRFAISSRLLNTGVQSDSSQHPLALVDVQELDGFILDANDLWLGLTAFLGQSQERISAYSALTVGQFLGPGASSESSSSIQVLSSDGQNLALMQDSEEPPYLVAMHFDETTREVSSELLELRVPTRGQVATEDVESSSLSIGVSPRSSFDWITEQKTVGEHCLRLFGRFTSKRSSGNASEAFKQVTISVQGSVTDPLAPFLAKALTSSLKMYETRRPFLALFPLKPGDRVSDAAHVVSSVESDQGSDLTLEAVSRAKGFVALLFCQDAEVASLDDRELDTWSEESGLYVTTFRPTGVHDFRAGNFRVSLRMMVGGKKQQSPILAAAVKQQITPDRPDASTEASFLGRAENFYASRLVERCPALLTSLGHVMMPSSKPDTFDELVPCDGGTVLMSRESRSLLLGESYTTFENERFLQSPEASRLREALEALKLHELFLPSDENGDGSLEWPSRTSYRHLWGTPVLAEYLDSYADLIRAANELQSEEMLFWATYPMSISIWDVETANGDTSVLLSPLHPLRLAWLAGVEWALYESELAVEMIGSVEGWAFPLVGPGHRSNRRLIGVPIDSGEDQLFLGWSMLLPAGTGEPRVLQAPSRIGSYEAPGSAVGGLNAASVDSALRAFRKMHPYISTLTVDLSAKARQNRLTEIDQSVLALTKEWSEQSDERLVGGVRVFDSALREGPTPHDKVTRMVRDNDGMLLTWSRYQPQNRDSLSCHVRFLQDAGTTIQVREGEGHHGAIGAVPLRRFVAASGELDRRYQSPTEPGIPIETGWVPFSAALSAVESRERPPLISAGMLRRDLEDVSAEWTVLGETFLSPAVIGSLMDSNSEGSKMLWEWRPPILDRRTKMPVVDRRPFVSIARVPDTFGTQLEEFLRRATGQTEDLSNLRKDIMSALGRRGVGLSSLLAMGGTHVAGAIGFYLAFALLDSLARQEGTRLVIPIDASEYFLQTLSGNGEDGRSGQRADLLLIDITDGEVCLTPIEVKCIGLVSASPAEGQSILPGPDTYRIKRACDQLAVSHDLLEAVRSKSEEVQGADRHLWFNSLATLVEAASRLSPKSAGAPTSLASHLAQIASGEVSVSLGVPVLMYFQRTGGINQPDSFRIGPVGAERQYRGLIASTELVFKALREGEPAFTDAWQDSMRPSDSADNVLDSISSGQDTPSCPQGISSNGVSVSAHDIDEPSTKPDGNDYSVAYSAGIAGQGVHFPIGKILNSVGNAQADFWPSNTGLNQLNIGVVGDLGTGKTELVKSLIAQVRRGALESQPAVRTSMLIFDVKGDFQSPDFLDKVGGEVLEPHNIPLNVFLAPRLSDYSTKPHKQAAAFSDTLKKIYKGIGPVQDSNLKAVIRNLFQVNDGVPPTLAEILDAYHASVSNPDSVTAILEDFVHGEIFSSVRQDLRPFADLLEGRVVVVALDKLGQDQSAKNALVALFLNLYYDYMLSLQKLPFVGAEPQLRYLRSFLVIDEAVNVMKYDFEVLMNLMLQGRQFGVGIVLASQYLSHFRESKVNYGQPLRTWFIHKVPHVTPKELEALGLPNLGGDVAARIPVLGQHEVLYKSFGADEGRFVRVHPYYELEL